MTLSTAAISLGIFAAAITSGATGQAFPLIAGPVFLLEYPAIEAIALTAICSLTGQLFSSLLLRWTIAYEFRVFLIGAGLLGVPLGTALLTDCNTRLVRLVLGALILASSLWALFRPRVHKPEPQSCTSEAMIGLCGGLTGGLVGASSVVPAIWYAARGLDKARQRAVTQPYIMAVQCASLASLSAQGMLDARFLHEYFLFVVPLLAGICIGVAAFHKMSSSTTTRAVMSITAASGLLLLVA
jgi:uncharacterized membrane protein YfcA